MFLFPLISRYTKYLYPMECLKVNLSNPNDLQQAIEGNKREGRRSSYGTYPDMATAAGLLAGLPPPPGILGTPNPLPLLPPAPPTSAIGAGRHAHFNGNGQKIQGKASAAESGEQSVHKLKLVLPMPKLDDF